MDIPDNLPLKPFAERKRMTRLGEALARQLRASRRPIVDDQDIWDILTEIYEQRSVSYLRGESPTLDTLNRMKGLLRTERVISRDRDYTRLWRVNELADVPADEAVCLVDPGTCISHLSAMQVFNLTDRRPLHLYITVASPSAWKLMAPDAPEDSERPTRKRHHHPETVRGRQLVTTSKNSFPPTTKIRTSWSTVTTVEQTFVDMLESPHHCGGMSHVLDVFRDRSLPYLDQVIAAIDGATSDVTKVRAGYIVDEILGVRHPALSRWIALAQRGGSRKLDPKAPYAPIYSEKWMISLNV